MGGRKEVDPGDRAVVSTFDHREDAREEVLTVDEPASPENVEHLEDRRVVNEGGYLTALGDARSSPVPSVERFRDARGGNSRGGRDVRHAGNMGWWWYESKKDAPRPLRPVVCNIY